MCDCFHLAFPNWHASPGTGASQRLRGAEPGAEDDSTCGEPSQFIEGERPRPQGSSPVEEYPEKYTDSDKEGEVERDPLQKRSGKKGKRSGLGSLFDKSSTPKMSKLKEVPSPESGVIVKTAQDGGAEGLVFSGGGKEGIFIKQVVPESPASKNLSVKEGDQILSATVYFDNVTYEDAIQILEHAQAYKVKLCLKRTPDITESEPIIQSEVIPEGEVFSPEMRGQGKTKRHGDARISWPKFPSFGKGRKSFTRSHSSSEADEQRKLELSPTTSDTESPIKTQEALKGKKRHKVKIPVLRKKGRKSSCEDQDTPTTGPIYGDDVLQTQIASDIHSPECLESPSGETPQVCVTEDLEVIDASNLKVEQNDQKVTEPETVQHKVELISLDSTLKTEDLTVAVADQESPSGVKSPDEKKKKKKERSELKMRIMGKGKSQKQDVKAKSSPKRLQTLGASIEITDPMKKEKSADIPSVVSHMEQEGRQKAVDTNTQVTNIESSRVISAKSLPTQMEISVPKVDLSLDMSDVGLIRKSPQRGKEKTKKDTPKLSVDIKQKTDTKTGPSFKLPKIDSTDIALEEPIQNIHINVEKYTGMKQEKSSLPKTQLPKREDIEIPGMEAVTMGTTTQGIKEPKIVFTGHVEEIQAETVQMSIDVDSVKEAVSKLPGFKLPQVDMSGVLIPEEFTVIDANAQRISVKTQGTPTKVVDVQTKQESHFTTSDIKVSPEISRTSVKLPKIKLADLSSQEPISETKVADKKTKKEYKAKAKQSDNQSKIKIELNKREDIIIPGKESTHKAAKLQAEEIEKTKEIEGIQCAYESEDKAITGKMVDVTLPEAEVKIPDIEVKETSAAISLPETSTPAKFKKPRFTLPKFSFSKPSVKEPEIKVSLSDVDVALPQVKVEANKPEAEIKAPETEVEFDMQGSKFNIPKLRGPEIDLSLTKKNLDVRLPEPEAEVHLPDIEVKENKVEIKAPDIELQIKDAEGSPSKLKMPTFKLPQFGVASPNITVEVPYMDKDIKSGEADIKLPKEGATVDIMAPSIGNEGPSIHVKTTGTELEGKGNKFEMPNLGLSMPKVKGPQIDFSSSKKDVEVTLPQAKAEVKLPEAPEIDLNVPKVDVSLPEGKLEVKKPEVEIKVPETELELDGQQSKFKMPKFGISLPKVKGPEVDWSSSKKDVDITLPEAKAEVQLPDIELKEGGVKVDVKAPEIAVHPKDVEGSPYKFKMPTFKLPKFGASSPSITVEVPDMDKDTKMDEADGKIPKEGATIGITAPSIDVKTPEIEVEGKGGKFKMPNLDLTMPKVKQPEIDLSLSKKDVDVTLPEAKAKVKLTGVEVKEPSGDILMEEQPGVQIDAKLKKPRFSLPRFSFSKPSVKEPEADVNPLDVDVSLPEGKVEVKQPEVEIKPPESEVEFDGQGSKFKMPKFGISLPKVTGPEIDLSLSKKDIDITLPEAKAGVQLPDVKLKEPSAKVEIKAPEVEVQVKDTEGSPSKFKMPTFKLPKFGAATPNVIVEVPELDKEINIDGAELKIPKEGLAVDITAPSIGIEGPSLDVKTTGTEIEGKGNKFKMPNFGISLPKVKGPEIDLSLSKKDVDVTLPEAKAGVQLPDVKLKEPSAKVEIKAPEFEVQVKDTEGSPSKFKMPTFKLPKFGAATPNVTVEVPELDKEINIDGAELKIAKEELAGPSLDVKTTGTEIEGKGNKFKMPNFGISIPKVKGPEIDLSLSKKDVGVTLPKKVEVELPDVEVKELSSISVPDAPTIEVDAKLKKPSWTFPKISFSKTGVKSPAVAVNLETPGVDVTLQETKTEVHIPDVEVKEPSAAISMEEPTATDLDAKLKKPMFSLPSFSFSKPSVKEPEINVDLPHVDASLPQEKLQVKKPEVEIKVPELESEHVGQGSKFKMPTFGISLPKVKGPEVDLSASKKDVHVTVSEAKPKVQLPNVEAKQPFAQVEMKAPEIEAQLKDLEGSPSKFKMPTFKMPKFGAAAPNITVEVPDVDNKIDGAQLTIRKEGATMDISTPKVKGPEIDLGLTKKDVTLPETKAEVKGTSATISVPDVPTIEVDAKLKKPGWSLPRFSFSKPIIQAPDVDVNIEGPEVDVTLPETKTEVHLPDVDVKAPSGTISMEEPPPVDIDTKLKKPMFSLPKFSFSKPTVKEPEAELNISEVDVSLAEGKVEAKQPHVEMKATEIEAELDGHGNKFKMPKFGISLPKVKGPDIDLSLSKKDADATLPEAKAEVQLPGFELEGPSAKLESKATETEVQLKDVEGSPLKFKMPTFKLPKFGVGSPNITAEVPDMDKDIKTEGAHMKIPEDVVDITTPSTAKDKGPEINLSLSKKDIEVTLPETKAEVKRFSLPRFSFSKQSVKEPEIDVNLAEVGVSLSEGKMEVKEPEVEFKPPEAEVHLKDVQGSPSKLKMPTFKLPKFGIATPDVTVEVPELDKEINIDGAELTIPKGEASADITTPSIDIEVPTIDEMKVPDVEVRKPSATISEGPTMEVDAKLTKPRFSLPRFSFSKPSVKEPEVDINLPRVNDTPEVKVEVEQTKAEIQAPASEVQMKDTEGSPSKFKMPTLNLLKFGVASPNVAVEVPEGGKDITIEEAAVDIKVPSVDIKANVSNIDHPKPETSTLDSEAPKTEIDSEVLGSPSKFKLPSFKMPKLSFSKPKPEDEYVRGDTECEHNPVEIEVEPQGLGKSSKFTLTSFGEILKNIDVEFDVPTIDEVEEKLTPSKEVCGPDELNVQTIAETQHVQKEDEMTEIKSKPKFTFPRLSFSRSPEETETVDSTNAKQSKEKDSVKSPERAGWLKFPKFGLSSPPEPTKISEKEEHESEKSPEEDVSTTCSVHSSDAFADISSTVTSEQVGLSLSSPTKVTVKYSDPNAKMGLGEVHGNVISSTTRTGLISVEPNLPEKITILSSGVSSSSIDTLKLESGKIHVITSNIQATPEAQHATILTDFQVQSAGGLQTGKRTVVQRHVVRETASENSETVVITKRMTHVFGVDPAEPISDETASSIQRLRDSMHTEKMRFFDGAKK